MPKDSFSSLFVCELDSVYRLAHCMCELPEEAADLVADTYSHAFKVADTSEMANLRPQVCLFKILYDLLAKRPTVLPGVHAVEDPEDVIAVPLDVKSGHFFECSPLPFEDTDDRLKQAIGSLSWPARVTILLWAVEELTYTEIAFVTSVSKDSVTNRLRRAREDIVIHLREHPLAHQSAVSA